MKNINTSTLIILLVTIVACTLSNVVKAQLGQQVNTPCTALMIATFTPCMNYITGSTANGSSPSSNCCQAFKLVTSTSMDCACLLVTGGVPLPSIINRTLTLALPRICKGSGVPIKCQATGTPLPAPGPLQFGAPPPSSAFSPQASKATAATPEADQPVPSELPPAAEPSVVEAATPSVVEAATPSVVEATTPSTTPRIRPVLAPPALSPSIINSPTFWLMLTGFAMLKL